MQAAGGEEALPLSVGPPQHAQRPRPHGPHGPHGPPPAPPPPPAEPGIRNNSTARVVRDVNKIMRQVHFTKRPGSRGFNKHITAIMRKNRFYEGARLKTTCGIPFAHRMTAAWLVGPQTPIDRLLVIHRTGSGKTFTMIDMLELYFTDPRPKVVIFPDEALVRNFYSKLKTTKTQYSEYFDMHKPRNLSQAAEMEAFRETLAMTGQLHLRGQKGHLFAPVRPMRYTVAGGRTVFPKNGPPEAAIFKIPMVSNNPFDNKIVLMDEVHNLVHPDPTFDARRRKALDRLKTALFSAENSVIVGLTATPFVDSRADGEELLKIIKGKKYSHAPTNEGFVSYFNSLPTSIYPRVDPNPSAYNVVHVRLEGANEKKYLEKLRESPLANNKEGNKRWKKNAKRLIGYCNMAGYYQQAGDPRFLRFLRTDPKSYATKFYAMAVDILQNPRKNRTKVAVMIDRRLGMKGLLHVLINMAEEHDKPRIAAAYGNDKKAQQVIDAFNSPQNKRGEVMRVLLVDTDGFGEGIDLLGVRNFYLAHPPDSYAALKQWTGRVLRACAYNSYRPSEREVEMSMFVSVLSDPKKKTADELMRDVVREETKEMEKNMREVFGRVASDYYVLKG